MKSNRNVKKHFKRQNIEWNLKEMKSENTFMADRNTAK